MTGIQNTASSIQRTHTNFSIL